MRIRDIHKEALVKQQSIDLLLKYGFEGFSMNRLARACNISVATLYIYYKDKDDLVISIAKEEFNRMAEAMLQNFDPSLSFEEGLRIQWRNRVRYMLANPKTILLLEQLKHSTYYMKIFEPGTDCFRQAMRDFMKKAVKNGEIDRMQPEVFWSLAYAPLYNLIRFELDGRSMGTRPFKLKQAMINQCFERVLRSLKK